MSRARTVLLANPRGFCAGVYRAIAVVERAIALFGAPIYVRHEVVHNRFVVESLREKGAIFIEALHEVPDGATLIFSAHSVPLAVREEAERRGFRVFDATCPLVTKVHTEVRKMHDMGLDVVMIGHAKHPEVEGTMGQCRDGGMYLVESVEDVAKLVVNNEQSLAYVSQTTLSVDETRGIVEALKARYPHIHGPKKEDICYATQNRQDAVKMLAQRCEVIIVVGSPNSSNSNRLREVASRMGVQAYMVDNAREINLDWLEQVSTIGITAGASAPEVLVQEVLSRILTLGEIDVQELGGVEEHVHFSLPVGLRD